MTVNCTNAQPFNAQLATMLNDTLNTYVSMIPNIKGMSAAVFIPGQGTWTGVTGISYTGNPVTPDMRMGIASNTKLFVSTIILKLAEKNILSLDDPLSTWLPVYPNINPAIKIRQLLNHTSGISDPLFVSPWMDTINNNPTRTFTSAEVLSWLGPPTFPAGTSYGYSNTNYIIAGMIAQNATGYHISRLIRDSILTPLNMSNTYYDVEEPIVGTIAHRWWNTIDYHDTSRVGLNTAGGCAGSLFSTPADMMKWYTALFNGQVINASSMNELTSFINTGNPVSQYGLGLSRDITQGYPYWGHGGTTWGYRSKMIYDSCLKVSVGGITNCYPSGMESVVFLLYRAVKNHIPGCSGAITGLTMVAEGTNSVTYTIPPIANATTYNWTLPSGITGISNTNSITVNVAYGAASGNIMVQGVNNYGPGGSSTLWLTVNPVVLPVTIISFTAEKYKINQSLLRWTVAQAANHTVYDIERSFDAVHFEKIGNVISSANTNQIVSYLYVDSIPGTSTVYYRLKTSDDNGRVEYSKLISLKFDYADKIILFPNPASEYIIFDSENFPKKDMTLSFYSSIGVLLKTERVIQNKKQYSISDLANGIYIVEIKTIDFSVKKLLLIKK